MRLLVEIGNTRAKWALANGARLERPDGCEHGRGGDWTRALPAQAADSVWFASVAPQPVGEALLEWAALNDLPTPRRIVSVSRAAGVVNAYREPLRLGVDRWLACLAARGRAPGESALVVDAGTALTVDFVAADGQHRGGLIGPGIATMRAAIRRGTEVRADDRATADGWLGTDTDSAVGGGTLQAALGMIERTRDALQPQRLFLAGGEAGLLAPYLAGDWESVPELVLEGLALAAEEAEAIEASDEG